MMPTECNSRDWGLYFNGCYMCHRERGFVYVQCDTDSFIVRQTQRGSRHEALAADLAPIWPLAGSINMNNEAMYISRRARREARRSCTPNHYQIEWGSDANRAGVHMEAIKTLWACAEYPAPDEALRLLDSGERPSVAVARDIILTAMHAQGIGVVCRGEMVGMLRPTNHGYEYVPSVPDSPVTRRVQFKLQKEGILSCLSI